MSDQTEARLTRQPVFLFVVATAMATTVATLAATALVKAEAPQPSVVCECAAPEPAAVKAEVEAPAQESPAEIQAVVAEAEPQLQIPRVRQAKATVDGPMDKDIIRRIVRAHINEVRYCYNQGLEQDPALAGRVAVQFKIGAQGKVEEATVASSDLDSEEVSSCIAGAVKRWKFPKARDGQSVVITYPFVLEPG